MQTIAFKLSKLRFFLKLCKNVHFLENNLQKLQKSVPDIKINSIFNYQEAKKKKKTLDNLMPSLKSGLLSYFGDGGLLRG